MTDKIYYPEVIENYVMEGMVEPDEKVYAPSVKGIVVQENVANTLFPITRSAQEVISRSLNTQSKKILGNYTFGAMGAFVVGNYESGVSGDIKISPDGIVGRNDAGETTFSIDGTTGDATFKGTLMAGVVVASGALVVGTNVGIGTAEDSAGVTTIIDGRITTSYINALNITAKYIVASVSISSPTITGGTITGGTVIGTTIKTKSTGVRVELNADEATIKFFDAGNDQVFLIDEASYGAVPTVRLASYDNRSIWIDSDDDIYITADVDLYLGVGTGSIVIADEVHMGGNLDMNSHNITEINLIQVDDIYDNVQGFIEIHDGLYISNDLTVSSWGSLGGDLDMNSHAINECTAVNPPSRTYVGKENLIDIVKSMQSTKEVFKKGKKWAEIDHEGLHPTLKKSWVKRIRNKKTGKVHEEDREGYGLFELVLVQNRLLIEFAERIEVLEAISV